MLVLKFALLGFVFHPFGLVIAQDTQSALTAPAAIEKPYRLEKRPTQISERFNGKTFESDIVKLAQEFDQILSLSSFTKSLDELHNKAGYEYLDHLGKRVFYIRAMIGSMLSRRNLNEAQTFQEVQGSLLISLEILTDIQTPTGNVVRDVPVARHVVQIAEKNENSGNRGYGVFFDMSKEPSINAPNEFAITIQDRFYQDAELLIENEDLKKGYLESLIGRRVTIKPSTRVSLAESGKVTTSHFSAREGAVQIIVDEVLINYKPHQLSSGTEDFVRGRLVYTDGAKSLGTQHIHQSQLELFKNWDKNSPGFFEGTLKALQEATKKVESVIIPLDRIIR